MRSYLILILISTTLFLAGCNKNPMQPQVCIGETCFETEIATTPAEHEIGLMNRTFMPEKSGMIFTFDHEDIYRFRMKNTIIPLDIIRIDSGMNIIHIAEAQPCIADPCTIYDPQKKASYVLEINYGLSKKL